MKNEKFSMQLASFIAKLFVAKWWGKIDKEIVSDKNP